MNSNQFETVAQVAGANVWSLGLCFFFCKLKCTVTVQTFFYNNYQNSRTLIGLQLLSIRVQTIKMMSDVVCTLSQLKIKPILLLFFPVNVKNKLMAVSMAYTVIDHKTMP